MSALTAIGHALPLPATPPPTVEAIKRLETLLGERPRPEIPTEHVIHGGMYARTVRLAPDTVITGALIKLATMVIVSGHAMVLAGDGWSELCGYNVLPASAGRKQVFVAIGAVELTMIFPTSAKSVPEAEAEFTDEVGLLLSRRDGKETITVTGE